VHFGRKPAAPVTNLAAAPSSASRSRPCFSRWSCPFAPWLRLADVTRAADGIEKSEIGAIPASAIDATER
jgi:hypothetical protein